MAQRPPEQPPAIRIPQRDDADVLEARKQAMALEEQSKKGRKSTNLTGGGASSQPYSRTAMG